MRKILSYLIIFVCICLTNYCFAATPEEAYELIAQRHNSAVEFNLFEKISKKSFYYRYITETKQRWIDKEKEGGETQTVQELLQMTNNYLLSAFLVDAHGGEGFGALASIEANYTIVDSKKTGNEVLLTVDNIRQNHLLDVLMIYEDNDWKLLSVIQQKQIKSSAAHVQEILYKISHAAEMYAHIGRYPSRIEDLTEAMPPYLLENSCNQNIDEYIIQCDFSENEYTITAQPSGKGKVYKINTGGEKSWGL